MRKLIAKLQSENNNDGERNRFRIALQEDKLPRGRNTLVIAADKGATARVKRSRGLRIYNEPCVNDPELENAIVLLLTVQFKTGMPDPHPWYSPATVGIDAPAALDGMEDNHCKKWDRYIPEWARKHKVLY